MTRVKLTCCVLMCWPHRCRCCIRSIAILFFFFFLFWTHKEKPLLHGSCEFAYLTVQPHLSTDALVKQHTVVKYLLTQVTWLRSSLSLYCSLQWKQQVPQGLLWLRINSRNIIFHLCYQHTCDRCVIHSNSIERPLGIYLERTVSKS